MFSSIKSKIYSYANYTSNFSHFQHARMPKT